jgi:acetyltransferase (GNAT) family protein
LSLEGPLGAFTDAVFAKLIELDGAEADYIKALGGRAERGIGADLLMHPALPHPVFNTVVGIDAEGQDTASFIRRIESAFASEGLPFSFVVSALSRPTDIGEAIEMHGFVRTSKRLWMELMGAPPSSPGDPKVEVTTTRDGRFWAATAAEGLNAPMAEPLLGELARRSLSAPTHALLLAHYDGAPAGTCELSVDRGIATLRRVATLPSFRQREVLRGLLHTACETAYAFDAFRIVTRVFPEAGAVPLFESLGFAGTHLADDLMKAYPPFLLD